MASASKNLTEGKPAGLILRFALPMMVGSIFQQLYTVVDAAIVGRFVGVEALAAVGASDWFNWLVLGIIIGFAQGFAIIPAQRFGARDGAGLRKAAAMAVLLTLALGAALTAVSIPLIRPVLLLLDTGSDILPHSIAYLRVIFGGILVVAGYNAMASLLRSLGNSRDPLVAMVIGALTNIGLDLLFVVGFHWGVVGAAAATVIGQGMSLLYTLVCLLREPQLRFAKADWKADWPLIRRELLLGLPIALQNAVIGVGGMAVQQVVNGFGYVFVAGVTATNKLFGLLEMAAINFGYAVSSYAGQNLGAGRIDRVKKGVSAAAWMAVLTSLLVGGVMILLGRPITGLFISSEDSAVRAQALDVAYRYLLTICVPLFILYLLHIYRSTLQGLGNTVMPALSGVLELVMRVAVVNTLPALLGGFGVYLSEPLAWLGADLILMPAYFRAVKKLERR